MMVTRLYRDLVRILADSIKVPAFWAHLRRSHLLRDLRVEYHDWLDFLFAADSPL